MATTLLKEYPTHFELHDGRAPFRVPKHGLSDHMVAKIKAMPLGMSGDGSGVSEVPAPAQSFDPNQEPEPLPNIPPKEAPFQWLPSNEPAPNLVGLPGQPQKTLPAVETPASAPVAEVPIKVVPVPVPVNSKGQAAAPPSSKELDRLEMDTESAIKAKGAAQMAQDNAVGDVLKNRQKIIETQAHEQLARATEAKQMAATAMQKVQAANDYMTGLDTTAPSTGHYWASLSTPGKILNVIGLILGTIGSAKDGINNAAVLMDKQIERDLQLQKDEHEMKFKKGQNMEQQANTMYGMYRQQGLDAESAGMAAKATALETSENELLMAKSKTSDAQTQANIDQLIQIQRQKTFEEKTKLSEHMEDKAIKWKDSESKRIEANAAMYKAMHPPGESTNATGRLEVARGNLDLKRSARATRDTWVHDASSPGIRSPSQGTELDKQDAAFDTLKGHEEAILSYVDKMKRNAFSDPAEAMLARKQANNSIEFMLTKIGKAEGLPVSNETQMAVHKLVGNATSPENLFNDKMLPGTIKALVESANTNLKASHKSVGDYAPGTPEANAIEARQSGKGTKSPTAERPTIKLAGGSRAQLSADGKSWEPIK